MFDKILYIKYVFYSIYVLDKKHFENNLLIKLNIKYHDLMETVAKRQQEIAADIKRISRNQNSNKNISKVKALQQKIKVTYKTLKDVKDKIIYIIKQNKITDVGSEDSDDDIDNKNADDNDIKDDTKNDEKESESIVDIVNNALNKLDQKTKNEAKLVIGKQYKIIYTSESIGKCIKDMFGVGIGSSPFIFGSVTVPGGYKALFQSFRSDAGVTDSNYMYVKDIVYIYIYIYMCTHVFT